MHLSICRIIQTAFAGTTLLERQTEKRKNGERGGTEWERDRGPRKEDSGRLETDRIRHDISKDAFNKFRRTRRAQISDRHLSINRRRCQRRNYITTLYPTLRFGPYRHLAGPSTSGNSVLSVSAWCGIANVDTGIRQDGRRPWNCRSIHALDSFIHHAKCMVEKYVINWTS